MRSYASVFVSAVFGLGLIASASARADEFTPRLVPAPVEKVFVPLGFDDNDNVEVIIHGHFPNTCYKSGPASATVDHDAKTVTVEAYAYKYAGECAQMLVPYIQSVKMGVVTEGGYKVVVKDQPDAITTDLDVKHATSRDPDDYLYAPVENVDLGTDGLGHDTLTISGVYPAMLIGCMIAREVKVTMTPGNVIVVQPIAEIVDGPECEAQRYSRKFSLTTGLTEPLAAGEYLAHVRILAASSINRYFEIDR